MDKESFRNLYFEETHSNPPNILYFVPLEAITLSVMYCDSSCLILC